MVWKRLFSLSSLSKSPYIIIKKPFFNRGFLNTATITTATTTKKASQIYNNNLYTNLKYNKSILFFFHFFKSVEVAKAPRALIPS